MFKDFIISDPFQLPLQDKPKEKAIYQPFQGISTSIFKKEDTNQCSTNIPKELTTEAATSESNQTENNMIQYYFPCPHNNHAKYQAVEFCRDCGARNLKSEEMKQLTVTSPLLLYKRIYTQKKTTISLQLHPDYLKQRPSTINFMMALGERMGICKPAVFLGIVFLDILLTQDDGSTDLCEFPVKDHLSLYGGLSVFLGTKGIELDDRVPLITALHYYLQLSMYTFDDLKKAEAKSLSILNFQMHRPTLYDLLFTYAGYGVILEDDAQKVFNKCEKNDSTRSSLPSNNITGNQGAQIPTFTMSQSQISPFKFQDIVTKIEKDIVKLSFLAIKDNRFYEYDLELMGAACICYLREKRNIYKPYRDELLEISNLPKSAVMQCSMKFLTQFDGHFRNQSFLSQQFPLKDTANTIKSLPAPTSAQQTHASQSQNNNCSDQQSHFEKPLQENKNPIQEEKNEQTIVTPKVKVEQIIELSTESQRSPLSIQAIQSKFGVGFLSNKNSSSEQNQIFSELAPKNFSELSLQTLNYLQKAPSNTNNVNEIPNETPKIEESSNSSTNKEYLTQMKHQINNNNANSRGRNYSNNQNNNSNKHCNKSNDNNINNNININREDVKILNSKSFIVAQSQKEINTILSPLNFNIIPSSLSKHQEKHIDISPPLSSYLLPTTEGLTSKNLLGNISQTSSFVQPLVTTFPFQNASYQYPLLKNEFNTSPLLPINQVNDGLFPLAQSNIAQQSSNSITTNIKDAFSPYLIPIPIIPINDTTSIPFTTLENEQNEQSKLQSMLTPPNSGITSNPSYAGNFNFAKALHQTQYRPAPSGQNPSFLKQKQY